MAARPRTNKNRSLPEHLYYDPRRGTYRLRLVSGKFRTLGKDRDTAVAIAREYNLQARPEIGTTVSALLAADAGLDVTRELPFAQHVDALFARIIQDETPSEDAARTMANDAERTKAFFANIPGSQIGLQHVNQYLETYHKDASANVKNRKVSWLKKLFSYAADESLMPGNPAENKKMRKIGQKVRKRLKLEWYLAIHAAAPLWLQTAMDLALQTTHARLEISRIRYNLRQASARHCGCVWLKEPLLTQAGPIYGTLYIHRQKTEEKEAAHVAIPIGRELKRIIDNSRDKIVSPYVVHRLPEKRSNGISKEVEHITQLAPDYISRTFSALRDEVGCCDHLQPRERPTFHEIRALSAHLFSKQGIDPQARMAHTDASSTRIYTQNHIEWVEVPYAEITIKAG